MFTMKRIHQYPNLSSFLLLVTIFLFLLCFLSQLSLVLSHDGSMGSPVHYDHPNKLTTLNVNTFETVKENDSKSRDGHAIKESEATAAATDTAASTTVPTLNNKHTTTKRKKTNTSPKNKSMPSLDKQRDRRKSSKSKTTTTQQTSFGRMSSMLLSSSSSSSSSSLSQSMTNLNLARGTQITGAGHHTSRNKSVFIPTNHRNNNGLGGGE